MKNFDKILCAIDLVLMVICLVLEFVPVIPGARIAVLTIAAIFNLTALVYFNLRKK